MRDAFMPRKGASLARGKIMKTGATRQAAAAAVAVEMPKVREETESTLTPTTWSSPVPSDGFNGGARGLPLDGAEEGDEHDGREDDQQPLIMHRGSRGSSA